MHGQGEAIAWLSQHPADAKTVVNQAIRRLTTRDIPASVLDESWQRLSFSSGLRKEAFAKMAKDAESLGYVPSEPIDGLFEAVQADDDERVGGPLR